MQDYLTAIFAMVAISCLWVAVQRLWRRHFPESVSGDGDALAHRSTCRDCHCGGDGGGGECRRPEPNQPTREAC